MIYDKQDCHKIQVQVFLTAGVYSMAPRENRDAHYGNQRSMTEYLMVHNSYKFPAEAQPENVPESILHQADEDQLKR